MREFRILHTDTSRGLGGQELRVVSEAKGMRDRGHEVVLAVPAQSPLERLAKENGMSCLTMSVGLPGWFHLVPFFLEVIKSHRIQFVHTHGSQDSWTASLAGRLSSARPIIIRARHKSTPIASTFQHRVLYHWLPHAVVTTGEYVRRQLIAQNGLPPSIVFSIPTGVDLRQFKLCSRDAELKKALGVHPRALLVGTVAFFRQEKGLAVLVKAMELLKKDFPTLHCVLVGDGPERNKLVELVATLGIESMVTFTGIRRDVPDLLRLLDVFVLPSLEEGIPQSLTQALAMECPVVATSVGGVPEVVHNDLTGVLVPPGDSVALAEKIAFLLRHQAQGKLMGQHGRLIVEREFSLEAMLDRTEAVYSQLWNAGRRHAA